MEKKSNADTKAEQELLKRQESHPNFRDEKGKLFLVRCYACEPNGGKENYLPMVATGICAWCNYKEPSESTPE